ncbi:MAG: M48 family metalloprotease, partial [Rectinema sp.]|nr:M48 family metalloprotease [Rectinema sp.]
MPRRSRTAARFLFLIIAVMTGGLFLSAGSCTISPVALDALIAQGLAQGLIASDEARLIREAVASLQSESQPFTAAEERAVGRVVAAAVLAKYPVYDQPELAAYVNKIGQGLAFFSDRPNLLGGYHVIILDSSEVHAIAAPGGYLLITRGLLRLIESEDMLAALLAHEISHVALGHGLASLTSRRMGELAAYYAAISAMATDQGNRESAALLQAAMRDFVDLVSVQGYSQAMEFEADAATVRILAAAGYRPMAIGMLVQALEQSDSEEVRQYSMLHPLPEDRLG